MEFWFWWILRGVAITGWIALQGVIALCRLFGEGGGSSLGPFCLLWLLCVLAVDVSLIFYEALSPKGYWWFCAISAGLALWRHLTGGDATWFFFLSPAVPVFQWAPFLRLALSPGRAMDGWCLLLTVLLSTGHIYYFSRLRRWKIRLGQSTTGGDRHGPMDL